MTSIIDNVRSSGRQHIFESPVKRSKKGHYDTVSLKRSSSEGRAHGSGKNLSVLTCRNRLWQSNVSSKQTMPGYIFEVTVTDPRRLSVDLVRQLAV